MPFITVRLATAEAPSRGKQAGCGGVETGLSRITRTLHRGDVTAKDGCATQEPLRVTNASTRQNANSESGPPGCGQRTGRPSTSRACLTQAQHAGTRQVSEERLRTISQAGTDSVVLTTRKPDGGAASSSAPPRRKTPYDGFTSEVGRRFGATSSTQGKGEARPLPGLCQAPSRKVDGTDSP